jgi:hypothetical protein
MNKIYKIVLIVFLIQLVATFKNGTTRHIIKNWFTTGELSFFAWFQKYVWNLSVKQIFGLMIIASFTVVTFPLGIWLSSFKMQDSYAIMNIVTATINIVTFPVTLYMMKSIDKFQFNARSISGIALIVLSKLIIICGLWFMYQGNKS